jgi:integrase
MAELILTQLIDDYVATSDEPFKSNKGLFISNHWQLRDDISDDGEWTEDLGPMFKGLSPLIVLTMKILILDMNGLRIQENCVLTKKSTFSNYMADIKWITNVLVQFDAQRLSSLDAKQINKIYSQITKRSLLSPYNSGKNHFPINKQTVDQRAQLLNSLHTKYQLGLLPDGLVTTLTVAQYHELIKPIVTPHIEWKKWLKGGSLGEYPLELALTLLTYSISVIQSNKINIILSIQDVFKMQVNDKHPELMNGARGRLLHDKLRHLNTYNYNTDTVGDNRRRKPRDPFHRAVHDAYNARNGNIVEIDSPIFRTLQEYKKERNEAVFSCLIIIIITSGIRFSEIKSLKPDSFQKDDNGNVSFRSQIKKTNHSIDTERPITGVALEAFNLLSELNLNPHPSDDLFTIYGVSDKLVSLNSYQIWVSETLKTLLSDFNPANHPNPTPHRFRHTWAELALRRFDGNVHEAVRSHFRHSVGSWMTMKYLKGKYHEDVAKISKDYMRELIGRAASGKEEVFGPIGRYILKQLATINAVTPENLEDLMEEFDIVDPHEYGYCMIRKTQRTQAKCFNKASQSPMYDQAKFELCGGCVGSLRLANHKDTIIRIGTAAQEHARVFDEMGYSALTTLSKKTMKLCEAAIKDFDNHIPLVEALESEEY